MNRIFRFRFAVPLGCAALGSYFNCAAAVEPVCHLPGRSADIPVRSNNGSTNGVCADETPRRSKVAADRNVRAPMEPGSVASVGTSKRPEEGLAVKVVTQREGTLTHFCVENQEFGEVTMTFDMHIVNLRGSVPFPTTVTLPARKLTEAFTLTPIQPDGRWEYSYSNYYKLGSATACHDDSCLYQLPFAVGKKSTVTQGYNGSFSHTGPNRYAIDFKLPEGTPVRAARGGVVVRTKDDSNTGGSSIKYDRYNNYVIIEHEDGTMAHYCHLQKGGVCVKAGQRISTGEVIAHSGNTGFSSGAHLHFCVFKAKDGRDRESIPVRFQTATEKGITLAEGRSYRAAEVQVVGAQEHAAVSKPAPATVVR